MSTGFKLNTAFNILGGVQKFKKDKQQHANDLAQQAADNSATQTRGDLAINALATTSGIKRRELAFNFLSQQKEAMARQGSVAVQAAWSGVEGGTANDLMLAVMQEAAQSEVEQDNSLRAIHEETVNRVADIAATTANNMDNRNFSRPSVIADILGIGHTVLTDARKSGVIG